MALAVSIKENRRADAFAPVGEPENSQFFLPVTNGFIDLSAANPHVRISRIILRNL